MSQRGKKLGTTITVDDNTANNTTDVIGTTNTVDELSVAMRMKQYIGEIARGNNAVGRNVLRELNQYFNNYAGDEWKMNEVPIIPNAMDIQNWGLENYMGFLVENYPAGVLRNCERMRDIQRLCDTGYHWYHATDFWSDKHLLTLNSTGDTYYLSGSAEKGSDNKEMTSSTAEEWYNLGQVATFGDLKGMKTRVDKSVRKARDITDFTVSERLIKDIEKEWNRNMFPKNVRAEAYKINIYAPGDKFTAHCDSQLPGLVGTALLGVYYNDYAGVFKIQSPDGKDKYTWDSHDLLMFYPDCPHEVLPGKGWRITISFRIFANAATSATDSETAPVVGLLKDMATETRALEEYQTTSALVSIIPDIEDSADTDSEDIEDIEDSANVASKPSVNAADKNDNDNREHEKLIKNKFNRKYFGVLLSRGYGMSNETAYGIDDAFINAVKASGLKYFVCDVITRDYFSWMDEYENIDGDSNVFIISRKLPSSITDTKLAFYHLSEGFEWNSVHQDYIEHVGNECREGSIDSIYINRAIIIRVN